MKFINLHDMTPTSIGIKPPTAKKSQKKRQVFGLGCLFVWGGRLGVVGGGGGGVKNRPDFCWGGFFLLVSFVSFL